MSLNGPSIASARPALQPCVSVLMVQGIQKLQDQMDHYQLTLIPVENYDIFMCRSTKKNNRILFPVKSSVVVS